MAECKYCGKRGLKWSQDTGQWRLLTMAGAQHRCDDAAHDDEEHDDERPLPRAPAAPKKIGTCRECGFWAPLVSQCRANSPMPGLGVSTTGDAVWPKTQAMDWCGDFSAKV